MLSWHTGHCQILVRSNLSASSSTIVQIPSFNDRRASGAPAHGGESVSGKVFGLTCLKISGFAREIPQIWHRFIGSAHLEHQWRAQAQQANIEGSVHSAMEQLALLDILYQILFWRSVLQGHVSAWKTGAKHVLAKSGSLYAGTYLKGETLIIPSDYTDRLCGSTVLKVACDKRNDPFTTIWYVFLSDGCYWWVLQISWDHTYFCCSLNVTHGSC